MSEPDSSRQRLKKKAFSQFELAVGFPQLLLLFSEVAVMDLGLGNYGSDGSEDEENEEKVGVYPVTTTPVAVGSEAKPAGMKTTTSLSGLIVGYD
eukprot:gene19118-25725_t